MIQYLMENAGRGAIYADYSLNGSTITVGQVWK